MQATVVTGQYVLVERGDDMHRGVVREVSTTGNSVTVKVEYAQDGIVCAYRNWEPDKQAKAGDRVVFFNLRGGWVTGPRYGHVVVHQPPHNGVPCHHVLKLDDGATFNVYQNDNWGIVEDFKATPVVDDPEVVDETAANGLVSQRALLTYRRLNQHRITLLDRINQQIEWLNSDLERADATVDELLVDMPGSLNNCGIVQGRGVDLDMLVREYNTVSDLCRDLRHVVAPLTGEE